MSEAEASVTVGIVNIPESRIWKFLCWIPRKLVGTYSLDTDLKNIRVHIAAMSGVLDIAMSAIMEKLTPNQKERVLNLVANYTIVRKGIDTLIPKSNPFTEQEIQRLRNYTQQAQQGSTFTPEQATEFRQLSERAARDYPNQDWVTDLLKIALLIFAMYAIGRLLNPQRG